MTTDNPTLGTAPFTHPQSAIGRWLSRAASDRLGQFLILLAFALLIRSPTFGLWNYDIDDQFYDLVGRRLLAGDMLYVDIWDRKGPGLYLFYAALAAISSSPLGYQLAATACAATAGYATTRIASLLTKPGPALLAGLCYCALLNQFGGENGQAPVIYNLLVAAAVWAIAAHMQDLREGRVGTIVFAGMFVVGIAITFKQSVAIEAAFLGLFLAIVLWRSPCGKPRALAYLTLLALAVAAPMLATFGWFATKGHFAAMWQALVSSNLDRTYYSPAERIWYLMVLGGRLAPLLAFAVLGIRTLALRKQDRPESETIFTFILLWAAASIVAVVIFPAVFLHYALPLLAPLCILAAPFFARPQIGPIAGMLTIATALVLGGTPQQLLRSSTRDETARFESYVRTQSPAHRIFVWGVPTALYSRLHSRPPSPILFAPHYYELSESMATGHDPQTELRRILDWRPEAVVVQNPLAILDRNRTTLAMLQDYVSHCRKVRRFELNDHLGPQVQWVYSDCAR
ncbi:hypothetical protein WBP06_08045 [Novosphingobium sp. BL-8H]|uniref:hypothetical protein n=1 Tax=Novosphingobium sp. BL-8H TaxID=3127640 RepID=UPI00375793EC